MKLYVARRGQTQANVEHLFNGRNQREYFYEQLDKTFPGLKEKYIRTYGNNYICYPLNNNLENVFKEKCKKYGLLYKMKDIIKAYKKENSEQKQLTFI